MFGQSRIIEEYLDTLLMIGILFFSVLGAAGRWNDEVKERHAEQMVSEFLKNASQYGYMTAEEYEKLKSGLLAIDIGYEVECRQIIRLLTPIYEYQEGEELEAYFAERNIRKTIPIKELTFPEETAYENLQNEENAVLLGMLSVSLPEEETTDMIAAVMPVQRVYTGEMLVTLCRLDKNGSIQFLEADPVCLFTPGIYRIELMFDGENSGAFVEVTVYERSILCTSGHTYANTKERIDFSEMYGTVMDCPYCADIPERIVFSNTVLYAAIGTPLSEMGLYARVYYKDGKEETILAGCDGWQDDYDAGYCGIQLVTVYYRGKAECQLTVVTEGGICRICKSECKNRCYVDYERQPFCNTCLERLPVYKGKTEVSEYVVGEEAFFEAWKTAEHYILPRGSSLQITVKASGMLVKEAVIRSNMEVTN